MNTVMLMDVPRQRRSEAGRSQQEFELSERYAAKGEIQILYAPETGPERCSQLLVSSGPKLADHFMITSGACSNTDRGERGNNSPRAGERSASAACTRDVSDFARFYRGRMAPICLSVRFAMVPLALCDRRTAHDRDNRRYRLVSTEFRLGINRRLLIMPRRGLMGQRDTAPASRPRLTAVRQQPPGSLLASHNMRPTHPLVGAACRTCHHADRLVRPCSPRHAPVPLLQSHSQNLCAR